MKKKKILFPVTIVIVIILVLFGVFSFVKANNEKRYYEKKEEVVNSESDDPVAKAINKAYSELIDVAKETDLPVKESFFEVKETTIDIHVLTTYGSYEVLSVKKPKKEEVLKKIATETVDLIKDFL